MDKLKLLWEWILTLSPWLRAVVLTVLALFVFLLSLSSCGTPKTIATVQNVNPNSSVTVTMSVSNSTTPDITVNPNVQLP